MAGLTRADLRSRFAFDHEVMRGMSADGLGAVRAFTSYQNARSGHEASIADGEAGRVVLYVVEYRFRHLVGPGRTAESAVAVFDLASGGNYPFSRPAVSFVEQPLPWSPHVHPTSGAVCLGDGWQRARGRMLAAQLVVHVMRLINFDEPDRGPGYEGWNGAAIRYWRRELRGRPFLPNLVYPRLPAGLTHACDEDPYSGFNAVEDDFRLVADDEEFFSPSDVFNPVGSR